MAGALQVRHEKDLQEVADVQAFRRRVEADVEGDLLGVQQLPQTLLVGALADEAALLQGVENRRVRYTAHFLAHSPILL